METPAPELESLTVVLVGGFQPALLQPSRLARAGLIRDLEADGASVTVISSDFTRFSTDWFWLEALPDRLQISTELSAYYSTLRDLAVGLVQSTPAVEVTGIGINHVAHFALEDESEWHKIGHALAPKDFWSSVLENPGTRNISMQGTRPDEYSGSINLTFEPSARVPHGIFLSSNDHYNVPLENRGPENGLEFVTKLLMENFQTSLNRSVGYFNKTLEFAKTIEGNG
ncbi:hypothetical protein ACIQ7S_10330 [Streptomyces griseoluteus]|uniref:hypothetical protein n=1 Tax=Streptomyces griseoluteus TaxID=29306 RepID=UPI00332BDD14